MWKLVLQEKEVRYLMEIPWMREEEGGVDYENPSSGTDAARQMLLA
jgi:hypothetical protein